MPDRGWLALRNGLAVALPIAVGLYAWREATHARFGRLLVLSGFLWAVVALAASTEPLPYSIGRVAGWISEVAIIYLLLTFPSGRLPGRADRALVLAGALLIGLLYVPTALLVDQFPSPSTWVTCTADCPANALSLVGATPAWVSDGVIPVREVLSIVLPLLVLWRLAYRLWHGTPLMRRALAPVLVVAMLRMLTLAAVDRRAPRRRRRRRAGVADRRAVADASAGLARVPRRPPGLAALHGGRAAGPRAPAARRARPRRPSRGDGAGDQGPVARPRLRPSARSRLGHRRAAGRSRCPGPDSDRSVTFIADDHGPVAALIHDATLREQRAFIEAVGAYALVWDENERLAERVDSSRGELRASRARILAAADDERRRIERDLHDGGQQRLVALRIRLQLAEDMMARSPAGARELLQRLAQDVDGVLEELRSLAAGVFPATLAAHGLPDAVRAAALQSPVPVTVVIKGAARYPEDVETAAYFCVLEALQNVAKHAPGATAAQVLLELEDDLVFEVRDDGPGFDMKESSSRGAAEHARPRLGARRRA